MGLRNVIAIVCSALAVSSCAAPDGSEKATATVTAAATDTSSKPIRSRLSYESANGVDSYAEILKGESFASTTLTARLSLPAKCSEPDRKVPAVIIQHGSGAPRHRWYEQLSDALAEAGIAALVPDSYSARRIGSTAADQTRLSKANRVYDAFAAFRALATVPCIDLDRIGITGYSFGGIVSRDAVESELAKRLGAGRVFKASLPVYPSCQSQWDVSRPTNTRVHFLLAELDDYTPSSYCLEHIPRLKASGWNVSHSVLPGAHHGFISSDSPHRYRRAWTFKDCGVTRVTREGYEVSDEFGLDVGKTMTWAGYIRAAAKACGKRGVTIGASRKTRASAMQFTVNFFSENL